MNVKRSNSLMNYQIIRSVDQETVQNIIKHNKIYMKIIFYRPVGA